MEVTFLKVAKTEFHEAVKYYESEHSGLGSRFKSEVQRTVYRIAEYPTAYQQLGPSTRRCLITKFPYGLIYQYKQNTNEIIVVAIAHLHRKPDYWSSRN